MRYTIFLAVLGAMFLLGLGLADEPAADAADSIIQSFERELNHEPAPPAPARRESVDEDVLYKAINPLSWTEDEQSDAEPADGEDEPETGFR